MSIESDFPSLDAFDDLKAVSPWLRAVGIEDLTQGQVSLKTLRNTGLTPDIFAFLGEQLSTHLPRLDDVDAAFSGFSQFLEQARSPLALAGWIQRDPEMLPTVLQLLAAGPLPAEILLDDPDSLEMLRVTDGQPIERQILIDELCADVSRAVDTAHVGRLLRAFRRREMLRIVYGDWIRHAPVARTTQQLSFVADAILQAALLWTERQLLTKLPRPVVNGNQPARSCIVASGELGGDEMSYGNSLNLLFIHEPLDLSRGPAVEAAEEFFGRLADATVELVSRSGPTGPAYEIEVQRLGELEPTTISARDALRHYDTNGLPWERMSLVKSRIAAGDVTLGNAFLEQVQPILYRRVLTRTDIAGLRMLKRKIERQAAEAGNDRQNIRQGTGGIRDVEFVIEFLQLLSGSALPDIRVGNTLRGIEALEKAGCLTMQERSTLYENYVLLRRVQHHLQILCGLECESIPDDPAIRRRIAGRLDFVRETKPDIDAFDAALQEAQNVNRRVLDHLIHDAIGASEAVAVETELVLDPTPPMQLASETLEKYGFQDTETTLTALHRLATETIPFLSAPRCRHFLAAIAPKLLQQLSLTPDPPTALQTMVDVTDSLGGKGALWELLSTSQSALRMVVRLCAGSPYLAGILTSNPGMIDDLVDSLVLGRLPQADELERASIDLCRGAEDIDPILRSFKNASHLRIGIRDVLGKADITETHAALAGTAEACLRRVAAFEHESLAQRCGDPVDEQGNPIQIIMLGLGKLGAAEPNYHSDLDVLFLYHGEGTTQRRVGGPRTTTTNAHFFNQLTQRLLTRLNTGASGERLYDVDTRIRPAGGDLTAVSLTKFLSRYRYGLPQSEYWQRLALTKARVLSGGEKSIAATQEGLRGVLIGQTWSDNDAAQIRRIREEAELSASPDNLKRGIGGTMDVEFIVSGLQLKHAAERPEILLPGTIPALEELRDAGILDSGDASDLIAGYRTLRQVESNVRLLNTTARHELPNDEATLAKLAYLIDDVSAAELVALCSEVRARNRQLFEKLI